MDLRLAQASACLSAAMKAALAALPEKRQTACEELRLRIGCPLQLTEAGQEHSIGQRRITKEDLETALERAAEYSLHAYADSLRSGFVTIQGGHRIGIGGQVSAENGRIHSYQHISSLNIRVARQILGAADGLIDSIDWSHPESVLFLAPPGAGKTTLLRDLARQLSDSGVRTALADERGELAALHRGIPQFEIGEHTDVLDGCAKAEAAMVLIKTMAPQLLVLDELTSEPDIRAAVYAAHCGTAVYASAHAWDWEDFVRRPLYQELLKARIFQRIYLLRFDRTAECIWKDEK